MAATNDEQQKRTLISILRSLCTSRKDSTSTMQEMFRDYKEAEGEDIPFRRFGYQSLEKMLTDSGEFTVSRNLSGGILIRAKVSEETQHITRMKAAEKKPKKGSGGGMGGYKAAPRRLTTNFNSRQNQSAYTNNYSRMSSTPMRSMPKYNQAAVKQRVTYTPSSNTYSYGANKGGSNGYSKPAPSLNNNNYRYKSNYVPEDRSNIPSVTYVAGVDMRKPQAQQPSRPALSPVKQPEAPKPVEMPKPMEVAKAVERKPLLNTPIQRSVSISAAPKTITITTNALKKVPATPQVLSLPPADYRPTPLQSVNVTTSSLNNRLIRHTRSYEDKLLVTIPNNGEQALPVAALSRKSVQDRIKIQRVEPAPQEVVRQPPPPHIPVQQHRPKQPIVGTEWDIDGVTNMEKLERYCLINKLEAPEYKCYRSKAKTFQGKVMVSRN
jgi:OST-HTH/LOTUS domain